MAKIKKDAEIVIRAMLKGTSILRQGEQGPYVTSVYKGDLVRITPDGSVSAGEGQATIRTGQNSIGNLDKLVPHS